MTTNTIYKAGSSPLTVTKVAKPAYAPTVSNSTRVRALTPGTDTTQPVALGTSNKGTIYKAGVPPVTGRAQHQHKSTHLKGPQGPFLLAK